MSHCINPNCLANYDFNDVAKFAIKRFVKGFNTIALLKQAKSKKEREEIALVCLLDVEQDKVRDLRLSCNHHGQCDSINCREKLLQLIDYELALSKARLEKRY